MNRATAQVTSRVQPGSAPVLISPRLHTRLGLAEDAPYSLRFGCCQTEARFQAVPDLTADRMVLPSDVAARLGLDDLLASEQPVTLTMTVTAAGEVVFGPLVGLLLAHQKLNAVLAGLVDSVYCRYARHAREVGAVLCFFTAHDLDPVRRRVRGYLMAAEGGQWMARQLAIPRIIYDRCFGQQGRSEAARVREWADLLGSTVVNRPVKITKLEAFAALSREAEVAEHLPYTVPFTPEALQGAMARHPDLYLKPDALYKGKGVFRLTRCPDGWLLQGGEEEPAQRLLRDPAAVAAALAPVVEQRPYVLQEGLPLATYLGNRFDFRALVQKDGRCQWVVSGLVARLAPVDGVITSPRSGGQVADPERVLQHAFPNRWEEVLQRLYQASLLLARHVDNHLGPCVELGLDVGVLQDGTVKLIEVNGKPLRVSLQRLRDPMVIERIHRFPIHCAVALDLLPGGKVSECSG